MSISTMDAIAVPAWGVLAVDPAGSRSDFHRPLVFHYRKLERPSGGVARAILVAITLLACGLSGGDTISEELAARVTVTPQWPPCPHPARPPASAISKP
jgi:hypothetical protein